MRLSFSKINPVLLFWQTGDLKYYEQALQGYLGIEKEPNEKMIKGKEAHELIANEKRRLLFWQNENDIYEKKHKISIDGIDFVGIIDLQNENRIADWKLSNKKIDDICESYKLQLYCYALFDSKINEGTLGRITNSGRNGLVLRDFKIFEITEKNKQEAKNTIIKVAEFFSNIF